MIQRTSCQLLELEQEETRLPVKEHRVGREEWGKDQLKQIGTFQARSDFVPVVS